MANSGDVSFEIKKDLGAFGDGKWQKHLTIISWNGGEDKYDIRPWNEDMTKMGKGITLSKDDIYDLYSMLEEELGLSDDEGTDIDDFEDDDFEEDDEEEYDEPDEDEFE